MAYVVGRLGWVMHKKTIKNVDIRDKRLLVRVDYNVQLDDKGEIINDFKIRATLPTLRYALAEGAAIVLISHMGRPGGVFDSAKSLFVVAKRLQELLSVEVDFVPECVGDRATKAKRQLKPGDVVLLENLRFDSREEADDPNFAAELAADVDIFVQDAFASLYRLHASTGSITSVLPSVAGLLVEKEMQALDDAFSGDPASTLSIINGHSIQERLAVIDRAIDYGGTISLGGDLGDIFLHAMGVRTGKPDFNHEELPLAKSLLDRLRQARRESGLRVVFPLDLVVAKRMDALASLRIVDLSANVVAEIEAYPKRAPFESSQVQEDEHIVDSGPFTGAFLAGIMQNCERVLLVGTPGDTTVQGRQGPVGPFAHGTDLILEAMSGQFGVRPAKTIVCGDDAVDFVVDHGIEAGFSHVSTGGGASIEVLAGHQLVGLEKLEDA